ncbi:cadherin EGF LAG seven-pass G-type receptor 2-like isoform X1, partial [Argonauta hians]
ATELKQMVVEEESPVGTVVKTSAAIVNGLKLLYNDFAVKCNINKCELVTKKVFDVDTMSQPFIRLHYQYPNDIPRTTIVNIKNINDNEPQFVNQPYKTSIPEDFPVNTTLPNLKIEAVDKDFNANKPELSLSNSVGIEDFMKLNMDGTIELLKPLDYETRNFFEFIAYANDSKYVTNASVWIQVTDVQDMPPTFISSSFVVNIPENSKKDAVVTTVKAIDQDRGVPHVINYEITSDACNHTFRVNNTSGEIRVAKTPFDRESTDIEAKNGVCTLDIMAYEVGNKQNGNATKRITIFVEDVNDNVPSFNKMSFNATVSESASKGNPIMLSDTITITDKDTVKYNKFRLSLTTLDDKPFDILKIYPEEALGETSVVLSVNKPDELDYEKRENISFKVVAVDVNNSSYSNAVTVDLKINPMNEFAPSFKQQIYYVNISENMKSDNLTTITADDEDKGKDGHLEYSLSGDTKFTINNETGQISVSALDYEAGGEYKLTIKATDGGNRNSETTLMVSVIDVNDNSPIFDQKLYSVRLDENKDSFERELIVKAKDADEPNSNNSKLNYSIEKASQNLKNNFTIDASGEIIPSKIDFDILTDNIIQLTILAVDSGVPTRNSTTIVNITV